MSIPALSALQASCKLGFEMSMEIVGTGAVDGIPCGCCCTNDASGVLLSEPDVAWFPVGRRIPCSAANEAIPDAIVEFVDD